MIKSLTIKNYALIRELDMSPSPRLSIITGETGAGKSIMLGAVGLLLGNRADTKALWDPETKCRIEGVFDIGQYNLQRFFEENDIDYEKETILRREITPSGKSRAFVNDTPTTLDVVRQLGAQLMDIHSQHESLQLGNNQYQQFLLDAYAQHHRLLADYEIAFAAFSKAEKRLEELQKKATESQKELDYQQFLLKELEQAKLEEIAPQELEDELSELENAEEIKLKLSQVDQTLDHEEIGTLTQLKDIQSAIRSLSSISHTYEKLHERIDSVAIELTDILSEVQRLNENTLLDPERQALVKEKLDLFNRLQQKHAVLEIGELLEIRNKLKAEVSEVANLDQAIEKAEKEVDNSKKEMLDLGTVLSNSRKEFAPKLSSDIESLIRQLGIENGQVEVKVNQNENPSAAGLDRISILFSANKGVAPREIKEVASGGEFSRLIFAIKFLLADKTSLPTIIFDEIDTGVSGEIALKMIQMMKRMSQNHQIISISHLPQFAAGGDAHFHVYKDHSTEKSETKIRELEQKERIEAIAKMIGGNNPSERAFESAKELLQQPTS